MKTRGLLLSGALALALALSAAAQAAPWRAPAPQAAPAAGAVSAALTGAERAAALSRTSQALNAVRTMQGRFTQVSPDGARTAGTVYLQRPGKLRFEYDAPNPLLVVSDGVHVAVSDRKMRTTDRIPLRATPLHFLLKNDINLERDARVTAVSRLPGSIAIAIRDPKGEADGLLTLYVDPTTHQIQRWRVVDGQGLTTDLALSNVKTGGALSAALFRAPQAPTASTRAGR